jgi:hypothetical protein
MTRHALAQHRAHVARSVGALPWPAVAALWNYRHPDEPLADRTVQDIGQRAERALRDLLSECEVWVNPDAPPRESEAAGLGTTEAA